MVLVIRIRADARTQYHGATVYSHRFTLTHTHTNTNTNKHAHLPTQDLRAEASAAAAREQQTHHQEARERLVSAARPVCVFV